MPEVRGRLCAMRSIELSIRGMTCAACAARIEKKQPGTARRLILALVFFVPLSGWPLRDVPRGRGPGASALQDWRLRPAGRAYPYWRYANSARGL